MQLFIRGQETFVVECQEHEIVSNLKVKYGVIIYHVRQVKKIKEKSKKRFFSTIKKSINR